MKLSYIYVYLSGLFNIIYSQYNLCDNCINRKTFDENIDCTNICQGQTTHLTNCLQYTRCLYDYDIHKVNDICICQKPICEYEYVCPNTEIIHYENENLNGYTVYEVSLEVKTPNSNIFAIYGNNDNNMIIPKAYQVIGYKGSNVGGINPLLLDYYPQSNYDSWLTISLTNGDPIGQVDAIGIDFSGWDENSDLIISDGAIFLDEPLHQISDNNKYIIAHLTLRDSEDHQMIINVNGKTNVDNPDEPNFRELNVVFDFPKKNVVT